MTRRLLAGLLMVLAVAVTAWSLRPDPHPTQHGVTARPTDPREAATVPGAADGSAPPVFPEHEVEPATPPPSPSSPSSPPDPVALPPDSAALPPDSAALPPDSAALPPDSPPQRPDSSTPPPANEPPGSEAPPGPFAEAGALEAWASLLATDGVAPEVVYASINDPARSDVVPAPRAVAAAEVGRAVALAYLTGEGREAYPDRWAADEPPVLARSAAVRAAGAGRQGTETWVLVVVEGIDLASGAPVSPITVMVPVRETADGSWQPAPRRPGPHGAGVARRGV